MTMTMRHSARSRFLGLLALTAMATTALTACGTGASEESLQTGLPTDPGPAQTTDTDTWEDPASVCASLPSSHKTYFGTTIEWNDGISVTVNEPEAEPDSGGGDGAMILRFPITVTNGSPAESSVSLELSDIDVSVAFGEDHRLAAFDPSDSVVPEGVLESGESTDFEMAFQVESKKLLRLSFSAGADRGECYRPTSSAG